jgi:acyl carrier protein
MEQWDSVAAITLVNVIEEEFSTQIDYDHLPDLDSFAKVLAYLTVDRGLS